MNSFLGKAAFKTMEREVSNEIKGSVNSFKNAFNISNSDPSNKNNVSDGSSTFASINFSSSASTIENNSINWAYFNYPPYLKIVHFNLSELPAPAARVCKFLHITFLFIFVLLIVNFIHTCVLAIGGVPPIRVCYSFLNFLILMPLAGYTFYKGYKGIAISSPSHINRYIICHSILFVIAVYFLLSPLANSNGLATFAVINKNAAKFNISGGIKGFWTYAAFIESLSWLCILILGGYAMYLVWTFNPYHSQQARASGRTLP